MSPVDAQDRKQTGYGPPAPRRVYLDAIAWNRMHPPAERLKRIALQMREADRRASSVAALAAAPLERAG